ncbi:hypothetical protein, partial [Rheinheimera riviphila]|uniref:hypothetical protein n=1 Tax=Rheinheimera riviphila TaxID=1834037 RepID=UPI00197DC7A2
ATRRRQSANVFFTFNRRARLAAGSPPKFIAADTFKTRLNHSFRACRTPPDANPVKLTLPPYFWQ